MPSPRDAGPGRYSQANYTLWLRDGDHLSPYLGRNRYEAVVRLITLRFLDRYLKSHPVSIALPARVRASGLAVLRFRV